MRALRTMNVAKRIATQTIHHHHTPYIFAARHLDVKVVSAKDNAQNSRQLEASRPISPHFTIYKWPFAGLASGTQRVTGFALVLGWTTAGLLSLPGLPITVLPIFIETIKTVPFLHALVKGGVAFSFGYHGTKNLFMPRLPRLDVQSVHKAATYAIIGGTLCMGIAVFVI